MRKQMLAWTAAAALAGLVADAASAQQPMPVVTTTTPVVVGTPQYVTPAPRGLFGRLRARRQGTVVAQPVVTTTAITPTTTSGLAPSVSGIQQAQGIGQPATGVQQAQYPPQSSSTQPMTSSTTVVAPMQVMPQGRMGLLARIRARRGL